MSSRRGSFSTLSPFRLSDLPLELRRLVYNEYLDLSYAPSAEDVHDVQSRRWRSRPSAILRVNKQIRSEVFGEICRRQAITCRISWLDVHLDGMSDLRIALKDEVQGVRLEALADIRIALMGGAHDRSMQDLTINIYPPHRDRPSDMVRIWENLRPLLYEARHTPDLRIIVVNFMENNLANWTVRGVARNSTGLAKSASDVTLLIDLYDLIRSEIKVEFRLPHSLSHSSKRYIDRYINKHSKDVTFQRFEVLAGQMHTTMNLMRPALKRMDERIRVAKCNGNYKQGKLWASRKELQHLMNNFLHFGYGCMTPEKSLSVAFPRDSDDEDDEEHDSGPNIFICGHTNRAHRAAWNKACSTAVRTKKLLRLGSEYDLALPE